MGAVAERGEAVDEARRIELAVAPLDRDPAVGQIDPRPHDVRHRGEAVLDRAHAAAAMDALDRELHAGDPAVEMLDEVREVARVRREMRARVWVMTASASRA